MDNSSQAVTIFPDLPREVPIVGEDGDFSPLWGLGFATLFQALQDNFKSEGIVFPQLSFDDISAIQDLYVQYINNPLPIGVQDISGQTVFDSTYRVPRQFIITYDAADPPNVLSASWVQITVMLTNAGDPNSVLAGQVNWLCYDITNKVLYICTTSGSTTTAVWTAI